MRAEGRPMCFFYLCTLKKNQNGDCASFRWLLLVLENLSNQIAVSDFHEGKKTVSGGFYLC